MKEEVVLLKPGKDTDSQGERDLTTQRVFWDTRPEEQDWAIKIIQAREEDAGMYQCVITTNSTRILLVELEVQRTPFRHLFKNIYKFCLFNITLAFYLK